MLWRLAQGAWVLLPLLPLADRVALWWWSWLSIVVVAVGWTQPRRGRLAPWPALLLAGVLVYLMHHAQPYGKASAWMATSFALLSAACALSQRGTPGLLRRALLLGALLQVPLLLAQACGWTLWPSVGGGLTGSLTRRGVCAALLAVAALWSSGRLARWSLLGASLATGSFMSLPVVGWRCWQSRWRSASLLLLGLASVGTWAVWWPRLRERASGWAGMPLWQGGWLTGWGFLPLPGGFAYDAGAGRPAPIVMSDYHNTWLDWIARTGLVGTVLLLGVGVWLWQQLDTARDRAIFGVLAWIGLWQSAEANAALALLGMVWIIDLMQRSESTSCGFDSSVGTP